MPAASEGERILVGIATWSVYDLKLLDTLDAALSNGGHQTVVDVFDVDDCDGHKDFERYIPGLTQVLATPVVGIWRDGALISSATGASGRILLAERGLIE
jgi:hypothetical protein